VVQLHWSSVKCGFREMELSCTRVKLHEGSVTRVTLQRGSVVRGFGCKGVRLHSGSVAMEPPSPQTDTYKATYLAFQFNIQSICKKNLIPMFGFGQYSYPKIQAIKEGSLNAISHT